MPFRRGGFSRRKNLGTIVNSIKNNFNQVDGVLASTNLVLTLAIAKDSPVNSIANDVKRGCLIKAIWLEWWYYGKSVGDVSDIVDAYLIKNEGNNLTPPNPGTVGTSNEKKFVFKEWKGLAGTKTTGGVPYKQQGRWFKIPKRYQRMGTDDRLQFILRSPTTGSNCIECIYKWYT